MEAYKQDLPRQLPWVEKYRPKQIDHIIFHQDTKQSLKKFINSKSLPHLLFYGPSGSGKTSTITCCANEIYGDYVSYMVLKLNASNERGIEIVRTKIKNFVSSKNSIFLPGELGKIFKMVILDEIDSMTGEAQAMLRQTIEKNSSTTRFCLICNDIDKINMALQSRFTIYRFAPLKISDMKIRLSDISKIENIKYEPDVIDAIIKISKGDMRSAINTLQHAYLTSESIVTVDDVYKISGHCVPSINKYIFDNLLLVSKNKISLSECVEIINSTVDEHNITIFNLLEELKNIVMESTFSLNQKIYLIDNFAQNEIYNTVNVDTKNILMVISSLFVLIDKN